MFWNILLAHLLADYPLQTDRMVLAKRKLPGLTVHVLIHLLVMIVLTFPAFRIVWPYLLVIAFLHFVIDAFKNLLSNIRPDWMIPSYIVDQILHILSLVLVAFWIQQTTDLVIWYAQSIWLGIAIGLVLVSHAWYVTERLLALDDPPLSAKIKDTMWLRMGIRVAIFAMMFIAPPLSWLLVALMIAAIRVIYRRQGFPRYWFILDALVAISCAIFAQAIPVIG